MPFLPLVLWAAVTALATGLLGWWTVPLVAALMVVVAALAGSRLAAHVRGSRAAGAGVAAALGWAGLVAWDALGPAFPAVRGILGRLFELPWPAVLAVTLALPALLAWCAAVIAEGALVLWRPEAADAAALPRAVRSPVDALALDERRSVSPS